MPSRMPFQHMNKARYARWCEDSMTQAVEAVLSNRMGYMKASIQFRVPRTTLKQRVRIMYNPKPKNDKDSANEVVEVSGSNDPVFSPAQEKEMKDHILMMDSNFCGLTATDVRCLAYHLAERNEMPHNFDKETGLASEDWLDGFKQHYPYLVFRSPEATADCCTKPYTRDNVRGFFDQTEDVFKTKKTPVSHGPVTKQVTAQKEQLRHKEIINKKAREKENVPRPSVTRPSVTQLSSGRPANTLRYLDNPLAAHIENGTMPISRMAQEVRELYLDKLHPINPQTCSAMSPRVILMRLKQKYIEKYTMLGLVKNEPLSDEEEAWESNRGKQECKMNLLEPVVEISDNSRNDSGKRKRKPISGESKKGGRSPLGKKARVDSEPKESECINVSSIKQEPLDSVPQPVPVPLENISFSVPIATLPVANNAAPLTVYKVPSTGMTVLLPQYRPLPIPNTNSLLINQQENRNNASTSNKPEVVPKEEGEASDVKLEQMNNVFVMPFGVNLETEDKSPPRKQPSPEPEIIECESPGKTARKNREAAVAASIGETSSSSSSHRSLRDLTFKLVELNNKNLQCDCKIDKIREEFKKRLYVAEREKNDLEHEIDQVLTSIQEWKDGRK